EIPAVLPAIADAGFCDHANADLYNALAAIERSSTIESGEVHDGPDLHRPGVLFDDSRGNADGAGKNQFLVACCSLLPRSLRRDVFEPRWTEHRHQISAAKARRNNDGSVV